MMLLALLVFTSLLIVQVAAKGEPTVECVQDHYLFDGNCHLCPISCRTCVSDTNCTVCKKGFYDSACEYTCVTWCDSDCHKVYGHCFHGCLDGTYGTQNDHLCRQCPDHCPVCESPTHCIACSEGWYGRICRHTCPNYCSGCDKSSGACFQCQDSYFLQDRQCKPCPSGCTHCVSDTYCTKCQLGVYGPVCENPCTDECKKTCHKDYGYCTYGCPDGEYGREENECLSCPDKCTICESNTTCVLCEERYFGETCEKSCPDHCTRCIKSSGTCLQCESSYTLFDGKCKACSHGCSLCESVTNCTQCRDSHFPLAGQCKTCPYGCTLCNTTNNCHSCEDGFYGPVDGRCFFKCPVNNETYNVPDKHGRCGIWEETDNNICHVHTEQQSCSSKGNCLQTTSHSALDTSVTGTYKALLCATVMRYECHHTCQNMVSLNKCEVTCSVREVEGGNAGPLCLSGDVFDVVILIVTRNFRNIDAIHCSQTQVAGTIHDPTKSLFSLLVSLAALSFFIRIVIVLLMEIQQLFGTNNLSVSKPALPCVQ